jgi:hypothetical protein
VTLTSELERAHPPAAPGEAPLTSRRLSILTRREIDDLYGLPRFTEEDQQLYFDLSAGEEARVRAMHTDSAKVHFVLQLGYFKAKRQFFVYACNEVQEDLRHILERHFPGRALATIRELSKPTRLEQQQVILNLFNYKRCGNAAKQDLERKAGRIAMRSTQPVYILREVQPIRLPAPKLWLRRDYPDADGATAARFPDPRREGRKGNLRIARC